MFLRSHRSSISSAAWKLSWERPSRISHNRSSLSGSVSASPLSSARTALTRAASPVCAGVNIWGKHEGKGARKNVPDCFPPFQTLISFKLPISCSVAVVSASSTGDSACASRIECPTQAWTERSSSSKKSQILPLQSQIHLAYPCSPRAHRLRETTATTEPLTGIGALGSDLCRKQNSFIDEHEGQLLLASTAVYRLRPRANCVARQR